MNLESVSWKISRCVHSYVYIPAESFILNSVNVSRWISIWDFTMDPLLQSVNNRIQTHIRQERGRG
jgi:hypothetical protein